MIIINEFIKGIFKPKDIVLTGYTIDNQNIPIIIIGDSNLMCSEKDSISSFNKIKKNFKNIKNQITTIVYNDVKKHSKVKFTKGQFNTDFKIIQIQYVGPCTPYIFILFPDILKNLLFVSDLTPNHKINDYAYIEL